jgi:hypothetical protein
MSSRRLGIRSQVWRHAGLVLVAFVIAGAANWARPQRPVHRIVTVAHSTLVPISRSVNEIVLGMESVDRVALAAWDPRVKPY